MSTEKAFTFASGDLLLEPFDRYNTDIELFDPCAEISDDELAAVGYKRSDVQLGLLGKAGNDCYLEPLDSVDYLVNVVTIRSNLSEMRLTADEYFPSKSKVPGAETYTGSAMGTNHCLVSVETNKGVFIVNVMGYSKHVTSEDLRKEADRIFDELYDLNKGQGHNSGNVDDLSALNAKLEKTRKDKNAFAFASGDLELGTWEFTRSSENIFDPCTEISDEEFKAIGWERDPKQNDAVVGWVKERSLKDKSFDYSVSVSGMRGQLSALIQRGHYQVKDSNSGVPGAKLLIMEDGPMKSCRATVETTRGLLQVRVLSMRPSVGIDTLCEKADEILAALWELG